MGQILSQEEVDALLKGITGGEIETGQDDFKEEPEAVAFDFFSHERIKRQQMPSLDMIHGKFVRQFRLSLSSFLRQPVDTALVSTKTMKFSDFLRSLPVPTGIHILKFEPLRGLALLIMESKFVFAMIDFLFGGKGSSEAKVEGREFTAIEQRMANRVVLMALRDLEGAWKPVEPIKISVERLEINPQFASISAPDEVVVVVTIEVEMVQSTGLLTLCIPYGTVDPVKEKLMSGFQTDHMAVDRTWIGNLKDNLLMTPVELVVELGRTTIKVEDLIDLKKGDVIRLDNSVKEQLIGQVENVQKLKCHPGATQYNRAVRLAALL